MSDLTWSQVRVKLSDLKPWPRNPRQIKQAQAERLLESFDEFDQVQTVAIGPDGEVYDGHQRLQVLRQEYGDDYELDARQASRELTEKERERLTVLLHRGAAGDWDFEVLANEFELDDLLTWGFEDFAEIDEATSLTEIGEAKETERLLGDRTKQIKPVLYVDEVAIFERAIRATGMRNRGEAVIAICQFYLEENEQEEGQFDFTFEGFA